MNRRRARRAAACCATLLGGIAPAFGQSSGGETSSGQPSDCPDRGFSYVRSEEDPAAWRDRACDRDAFDRLRYIPLGGETVLSVGGELRARYELYTAFSFGDAPEDDDGGFLARGYAFGDLRVGERFRVFGHLRASEGWDREARDLILDDAGFDVQEAFVEFGRLGTLSARIGRQELSFPLRPPSRLLSARNGPNVRRTWDAARVIGQAGDWRGDLFYAYEVEPRRGDFDDATNEDRSL